ncbi:MAG: alkaline phosphatase family protein [Bacillota bacterium]
MPGLHRAKRAIVFGIDCAMLSLVEHFMDEGVMPNFRKLAQEGAYSESLPSVPVDTPTNWTTIATGAEPATHGIQGFTAHYPGELLDIGERDRDRNKYSTASRAEFLWTAAEREEKRTLIINYPTGWPGAGPRQVVLGGLTPGGRPWRMKKACVYATGYPEGVALDFPNKQIGYVPLRLHAAEAWSGKVESRLTPLEAEIRVGDESHGERMLLLLTATTSDGYDHVTISPSRDASQCVASLAPNEWTPWLVRTLGDVRAVFRVKVVRLSRDARHVELYCTDVFRAEGWSYPSGLESEILSRVGPYVEGLECPYVPVDEEVRPYGPLNVSPDIILDLAGFQAEWIVKSAEYIGNSRGWDVLFLHYHLIDSLNHTFLGYLDPEFPCTSGSLTDKTWQIYRDAHRIIDQMVGAIVRSCADETTVLVITSDHGSLPCWRYVSIADALAGAGLLEYAWDTEAGKFRVDLSRSKAVPYLDPQHIWVNLAGREVDGIVSPGQYEVIRERILATLNTIRDPETGECPIALACRPKDLGIVGPAQDRVGDVLYFLKPGYTSWDGQIDSLRFGNLRPERMGRSIVRLSSEVAGHHTPYLPTATYKSFQNSALTFFCGPGVRQGYRRSWPIRLKDIAPTLSHLLGIKAPAQSEGSIVGDMLE